MDIAVLYFAMMWPLYYSLYGGTRDIIDDAHSINILVPEALMTSNKEEWCYWCNYVHNIVIPLSQASAHPAPHPPPQYGAPIYFSGLASLRDFVKR